MKTPVFRSPIDRNTNDNVTAVSEAAAASNEEAP
jgi:hypothetical protein